MIFAQVPADPSVGVWGVVATVLGSIAVAVLVKRYDTRRKANQAERNALTEEQKEWRAFLRSEMSGYVDEVRRLRHDVANLTQQLGEVEGQLAKVRGEKDAAIAQVDAAARRAAEADEARRLLAHTASEQRAADAARIRALQEEVDGLRTQVIDLKTEVGMLRSRIATNGETPGLPGGRRSNDPQSS